MELFMEDFHCHGHDYQRVFLLGMCFSSGKIIVVIYTYGYIYIHDGIITYYIIYNQLVVLTILKHMKVNGKDDYPIYEMENKTHV
jgi:hypothetical protein